MSEDESSAEESLSQGTWPHSQAAADFFSLLYGLGESWTIDYSGESHCMTDDQLCELMDKALPEGLIHSEWSRPVDFDKTTINTAIATLADASELDRLCGSGVVDLGFYIEDLGQLLLTNHMLTEGFLGGHLEIFEEFLPETLDDAWVQLCPKEADCLDDEEIIRFFNQAVDGYISYIEEGMLATVREHNLPVFQKLEESIVGHIEYLREWRKTEIQEFNESAESRKSYLEKERARRSQRQAHAQSTSGQSKTDERSSKKIPIWLIVIGVIVAIKILQETFG